MLKAGRSYLRSAALSQKAALQMSSPSTTPLRENAFGALRRARQTRIKNNSSAIYAQSAAEGILNRFVSQKRLSAEEQQTALFSLHSCNLCNYDNFS